MGQWEHGRNMDDRSREQGWGLEGTWMGMEGTWMGVGGNNGDGGNMDEGWREH